MLKQLLQALDTSFAGRWFAAQEPRDRLLYLSLGALLLAVVLWAGIWRPLSDWQSIQANRHANAQTLLDWLQANKSRVQASLARGVEESASSVLPVVTRTAESRGIKVGRLQPESDGVVSVTLQSQPFNDIVAWIGELQGAHGVAIIRASIDAQETPGLVNAQLRFQ